MRVAPKFVYYLLTTLSFGNQNTEAINPFIVYQTVQKVTYILKL